MPHEQAVVRINRVVPILPVPDVAAAVDYYQRVLGFAVDFLWRDPPTHAGVHRDRAAIQFALDPDRSSRSQCEQFFFVEEVDALYASHVQARANIVSPLENKPWGMREYSVRDPWGHESRFAGPVAFERPADALDQLPPNIRIVERMPTLEEYVRLIKAVGWNLVDESAPVALKNSSWGAVAVDESAGPGPQVVGMIRIVGDGARCCSINDVAVTPAWQNRRVGTALVDAAMAWLRRNVLPGTFVGLFTTKPDYYERWGFESGGGMHLRL